MKTEPQEASNLIKKYGLSFILFSNLWEVERAMSPEELVTAHELRMAHTGKITKSK